MGATWIIWLLYSTRNVTLQVSQSIHTQDKSGDNIRDSRTPPPQICSIDVFHGCNLSCCTRSNICTTESRTCNPFSKIREWTQRSIEDPSINIQKSKPPSSTSEGASQEGRTKENPRSEPGSNRN